MSTLDQTTANQERELHQVASRAGLDIVRVYKDQGISGVRTCGRAAWRTAATGAAFARASA